MATVVSGADFRGERVSVFAGPVFAPAGSLASRQPPRRSNAPSEPRQQAGRRKVVARFIGTDGSMPGMGNKGSKQKGLNASRPPCGGLL